MRLNKRILEAIADALNFVEAGEWDQDSHGDVSPDDYEQAERWVYERLARYDRRAA